MPLLITTSIYPLFIPKFFRSEYQNGKTPTIRNINKAYQERVLNKQPLSSTERTNNGQWLSGGITLMGLLTTAHGMLEDSSTKIAGIATTVFGILGIGLSTFLFNVKLQEPEERPEEPAKLTEAKDTSTNKIETGEKEESQSELEHLREQVDAILEYVNENRSCMQIIVERFSRIASYIYREDKLKELKLLEDDLKDVEHGSFLIPILESMDLEVLEKMVLPKVAGGNSVDIFAEARQPVQARTYTPSSAGTEDRMILPFKSKGSAPSRTTGKPIAKAKETVQEEKNERVEEAIKLMKMDGHDHEQAVAGVLLAEKIIDSENPSRQDKIKLITEVIFLLERSKPTPLEVATGLINLASLNAVALKLISKTSDKTTSPLLLDLLVKDPYHVFFYDLIKTACRFPYEGIDKKLYELQNEVETERRKSAEKEQELHTHLFTQSHRLIEHAALAIRNVAQERFAKTKLANLSTDSRAHSSNEIGQAANITHDEDQSPLVRARALNFLSSNGLTMNINILFSVLKRVPICNQSLSENCETLARISGELDRYVVTARDSVISRVRESNEEEIEQISTEIKKIQADRERSLSDRPPVTLQIPLPSLSSGSIPSLFLIIDILTRGRSYGTVQIPGVENLLTPLGSSFSERADRENTSRTRRRIDDWKNSITKVEEALSCRNLELNGLRRKEKEKKRKEKEKKRKEDPLTYATMLSANPIAVNDGMKNGWLEEVKKRRSHPNAPKTIPFILDYLNYDLDKVPPLKKDPPLIGAAREEVTARFKKLGLVVETLHCLDRTGQEALIANSLRKNLFLFLHSQYARLIPDKKILTNRFGILLKERTNC